MTAMRTIVTSLLCAAALATAPTVARAADELMLYRRHEPSGTNAVSFFVRGARPGETVSLVATLSGEANDGALQTVIGSVVADAAGGAYIPIADENLPDLSQPFVVQAAIVRSENGVERPVWSNRALLRDPPALWLLVDGDDSTSRVLRFDASLEQLTEERRGRASRDGVLSACGGSAVVKEAGSLVALDTGTVVDFEGREEPIDLALTPDQSAWITLTREPVAGGHSLLRLRVLDALQPDHQLGSFELMRAASRLVSAWLVVGDDSHRVIMAERGGVVREIVLGAALESGVTLLSLGAEGHEELVDCVVSDDRLIVVTRAAPGQRGGTNRLLIVDLKRRDEVIEYPLSGRPLDLAIATAGGGLAAFVAVDSGRIERIALDGVRRGLLGRRSVIELPGALKLAVSASGDQLYIVASDLKADHATVALLDGDGVTVHPLATLDSLSHAIQEIGTLEAGERSWMWLIERRRNPGPRSTALVDDQLWWCELDDVSGLPLGPAKSLLLGGRSRRVATH